MSKGPFELCLVRHGESVRNHASDLAHRGDTSLLARQMVEEQDEATWPLTERGHEQAGLAGNWIRANLGIDFDEAYVSPYVRTQQTADGLGLGLHWRTEERVREREWGDYSAPGFPPYSVQNYLADLSVCSDLTWKTAFPGAESVLDMVPRVQSFLGDALEETPIGRILVVTHGGTIRAFQSLLERLWLPGALGVDHRLSNCCIVMYRLVQVDLDRGEWIGEVRTAHPALPGAPETPWQAIGQLADRTS